VLVPTIHESGPEVIPVVNPKGGLAAEMGFDLDDVVNSRADVCRGFARLRLEDCVFQACLRDKESDPQWQVEEGG
jgi:hypothetical protein